MVSSYIKKHIAEKQDCSRTLTHIMKGIWYFIFMEQTPSLFFLIQTIQGFVVAFAEMIIKLRIALAEAVGIL